MKMVSAAKLRGDQSRLNAARPFAVRFLQIYPLPYPLPPLTSLRNGQST
jgi:hypothetical protein